MKFGGEQLLVRQLCLVLSDERGRKRAAEGVFDHLTVLRRAQKYADRRVFMGFAVIAIEGFEIELQLAEILGLEAVYLQLDRNQTVEPSVKKQHIEREVSAPNLHRIFRSDEAEVAPEFDKKFLEPRQQTAMQVVFRMGHRQVKKLDKIGVLQNAVGRISMNLSHHW